MKSSLVDLGPVAVDLAPMSGSNAVKSEGRHLVVSGHATVGINERQMGATATGKKPEASVTHARAR
jgi:hypothetical protein